MGSKSTKIIKSINKLVLNLNLYFSIKLCVLGLFILLFVEYIVEHSHLNMWIRSEYYK